MRKAFVITALAVAASVLSTASVAQGSDPIVTYRMAAKEHSKAYSARVATAKSAYDSAVKAAKKTYDDEVKAAKAERKAADDEANKAKEEALKHNPIKKE